jgi:hypothetical protein
MATRMSGIREDEGLATRIGEIGAMVVRCSFIARIGRQTVVESIRAAEIVGNKGDSGPIVLPPGAY